MKYSPKEAERLILNAVERNEPGLFCGNMGLALRYFDFAYHAESESLRNAMEACGEQIVAKIIGRLHSICNGFGYGLAGIGWALCLLIEREQLDGDCDLFIELDARVSETNVAVCDLSLASGLEGYLHYILARAAIVNYDSGITAQFLASVDCAVMTLGNDTPESLRCLADEYIKYRDDGVTMYSPMQEYGLLTQNMEL